MSPFLRLSSTFILFLLLLWTSLFLERREEVTLKNCVLQVVLERVQFKSRSSICYTFQDKRFLGFTLVTSARGILRERGIVELSEWRKDHIKGRKILGFEKWRNDIGVIIIEKKINIGHILLQCPFAGSSEEECWRWSWGAVLAVEGAVSIGIEVGSGHGRSGL